MKEITYLKTVKNGYILGAQTLDKKFIPSEVKDKNELHAEVIDTKEEYDNLLALFKTAPQAEEGFTYNLKTDLTWEKCKAVIIEEEATENANTNV